MAGPYLPLTAFSRSAAVRIAGKTIVPGQVTYVDTTAANFYRDLRNHSAIGQVYTVGPLTYRAGASGILTNVLTANAASIATAETLVLTLQIPANFLVVGSVLDIEAMGTVSASTSTTMTANTRFGTLGTTGDAIASAAAVSGITTAQTWRLDVEGEIRTVGASATLACNSRLTAGTTTISHGTTAVTTFDSTGVENVDLCFVASGGSVQNITVQNANIKFFQ